jgi:hypothetical protein
MGIGSWAFTIMEVTMPKFPGPPPRIAQKTSELVEGSACRNFPSAVTT